MKFDNIKIVYNPPRLSKSLAANIIRLKTLIKGRVSHPESREQVVTIVRLARFRTTKSNHRII